MIGWGLFLLIACGSPEPAGFARRESSFPRLSLQTAAGRREQRAAVEAGLSFLAGRQSPEVGSVGSKYQVAVTSLAGLAFLGGGYGYNRGRYGRNVVMCVNYLLRSAGSEVFPGYMARAGEDHSMYGHGYGLLFLTQVYGELPPRVQRRVGIVISKGVRVAESASSVRGGWYYDAINDRHQDENSVTVCVLQALRAARNVGFAVDREIVAGARRYLSDCQNDDGSFQYSVSGSVTWSSFELTAGAVSSLQALGNYGSDEVRKGLDYLLRCLAKVPGRPLDAAERYPFYGNFYAAQAFRHAGGRTWEEWYPAAYGQLLARWRREGGFESQFGEEYATAMAVLMLEIPLGYLPIFQE